MTHDNCGCFFLFTCCSLRNDTTSSRFSGWVTTAWAGTLAKWHFSCSVILAKPSGQMSLKSVELKALAQAGPLPEKRCGILHEYKAEYA